MSNYRSAPEVAAIAEELIETVKDHADLADVRIEYVFIDKAPTSAGRVVLGRARRIGGLNAVLTELDRYQVDRCEEPRPFYVIEISEDTWHGLNDERRRALVDHELMHCRVDFTEEGAPVLKVRGHDYEEFAAIIRRHGLWTSAAERVGAAVVEQLALAIDSVGSYLSDLSTPPPGVDPETGEITP